MHSQTYTKAQLTKIVARETSIIEKRNNPRSKDRREVKRTIRVLLISGGLLFGGSILRYTAFRQPFEVAPWQPLLVGVLHAQPDLTTTEVSAKGSVNLADKHDFVHPKS